MSNIEEHIRRAVEDGKFDNLPGKGKPLRLDENPFEDPGWRTAHHILRNAGFTLPWIETRREIEIETLTIREMLARSWQWRKDAIASSQPLSAVDDEWQRAMESFQAQIAALNQRISSFNLEAPSPQFQLLRLDADRELAAITSPPA